MADFHQHARLSTIHDFGTASLESLEGQLEHATKTSAVGLILPVTASDMRAAPFGAIVDELAKVTYVKQIAVILGVAPDEADLTETLRKVAPLGDRVRVLWDDGPEVQSIYGDLMESGIDVSTPGKGRSVWTGMGFLLDDPSIDTIALHDCDIVGFHRSMLARLCLPIAHPSLDFDYCKAYYARVAQSAEGGQPRMHGRVVRLFVSPLIRAMRLLVPDSEFLRFIADFRYPLAGEFAMNRNLARTNRVPSDWGLEVGTLAEVFRNSAAKKVCQVDLGLPYEHKHQPLSADDPNAGLMRMASDIVRSLIATLASQGVVFSDATMLTLRSAYLRAAQDGVRQYAADALVNGLLYERDVEEQAVEAFASTIRLPETESEWVGAAIPNWTRVVSALPDLTSRIRAAAS